MIYDESAMLSYDYRSQFRMVFSGTNPVHVVLLVVEGTVVHLIQFSKDGRSFLFFPLVYSDRLNLSSGQIIRLLYFRSSSFRVSPFTLLFFSPLHADENSKASLLLDVRVSFSTLIHVFLWIYHLFSLPYLWNLCLHLLSAWHWRHRLQIVMPWC